MINEKKDLMKAKAEWNKKKASLEAEINTLTENITKHLEHFDQDVSLSRDTFNNKVDERVDKEYEQKVQEMTQRIAELESQIAAVEIDESDSTVRDAIERRDYLNAAAISVQEYYNILLHVSEPEFIELAVTTKIISFAALRKEMKKMDYYKLSLSKLESKPLINIDGERSIWLQALLLGWLLAFRLPFLIIKAVKRAKVLHLFSRKYYILMETLLVLSQAASEEIIKTLQGVVEERKDNLYQKKAAADEALNQLYEEIQEQKDREKESCPDFEERINNLILESNKELDNLRADLAVVDDELRIITEKLNIIIGKEAASFREIRERFLNPSNTDKSRSLPPKLIYKFADSQNTYFNFVSGLWVYTDRTLANTVVLAIVYQLRNYMAWGSITFQMFDVLMATFLNGLMFPDNCDIRVHSMRAEQDACIDVLHDMLVRRSALIFSSHEDISQYNNYQAGIDAPTLPYEVVIIFQEAVTQLSEKLVQILSLGPKLGVTVCVFLRDDFLNESSFKTYERYVENVVEVTKTGITPYEPPVFGLRYVKKPEPPPALSQKPPNRFGKKPVPSTNDGI